MKIKRIHGMLLGFDTDPPLGNARGVMRRREFFLVAIETEGGHLGWGEVFNAPFAASGFVRGKLAPLLLGRSVLDRLEHFDAMGRLLAYDRRGANRMAQSAVDMALHDAAGQVLGQSVSDLLGGPLRREVFAYASGPFMDPVRGYADYPFEIEKLVKAGFRAIKPRAGLSPREDGEMVRSLRARVGDDVHLMVDINQGYARPAAMEAVQRMEGQGLLWIEEPLPPEDVTGYTALAHQSRVPLAAGEALGSLASFREYLQSNAFSILQPDPTVCGGMTGYHQVAALAAAFDVPVLPHSFGTAVGMAASIHLAAIQSGCRTGLSRDYPFVEIDVTNNPLLAVRKPALSAQSTISVPSMPGLGLDLRPVDFAPWLIDSWTIEG